MLDRTFLNWPFFEDKHRELHARLESFCEANLAGYKEQSEDHDLRHFVALLGRAGFLKLSVPGEEESSLDVRSLCLVRETLARYSALSDFSFAMQGIGSGPISLFGNSWQRERYLRSVAEGKFISAFALSELEAGSDVAAIKTSASLDGEHYIINGSKTWISNAGLADFYVLFAKTSEAPGTKGISAFVVEKDAPGFKVSKRIEISSPHPVGTLEFTNCRVPKTALLGNLGDGFKIAMSTLDVFRPTVGAAALGLARRAFSEALYHAERRKLFGQALSTFQITQAKVADMAVKIDASALLVYRAAWTRDLNPGRISREASMAKLYATESAQEVIDQAVQLLGGLGVVKDSVVERLYRDIRPLRIYEGTSEIQKLVIANQIFGSSK